MLENQYLQLNRLERKLKTEIGTAMASQNSAPTPFSDTRDVGMHMWLHSIFIADLG